MTPQPTNSYDLVPYDSEPFSLTHPTRMATIGALFGLEQAGRRMFNGMRAVFFCFFWNSLSV